MATLLCMLCNIQGGLGDLILLILKKRQQRHTLIALFNYVWYSFKDKGARLLGVLCNEERDTGYNLHNGCSNQIKKGKKINEGDEAVEKVYQRGCRGAKM